MRWIDMRWVVNQTNYSVLGFDPFIGVSRFSHPWKSDMGNRQLGIYSRGIVVDGPGHVAIFGSRRPPNLCLAYPGVFCSRDSGYL